MFTVRLRHGSGSRLGAEETLIAMFLQLYHEEVVVLLRLHFLLKEHGWLVTKTGLTAATNNSTFFTKTLPCTLYFYFMVIKLFGSFVLCDCVQDICVSSSDL